MIDISCLVGINQGEYWQWAELTIPIPQGVLVFATDAYIIKKGDGVHLWSELPVFIDLATIRAMLHYVQDHIIT
jgi:hypothetical protein